MSTMTTWQVPDNLSNEQAIELAYSLLEQMESNQLTDNEIEQRIIDLAKSKTGARNFLGAYLTSNSNLPDSPSVRVINALKSSPEIVSELMVKNLAMSTTMAITHRRNNDEENAQGSDKVCQRSAKLIKALNLDIIQDELNQLLNSITTGEGEYQAFLERWGYDQEQLQAMATKVTQVLKSGVFLKKE
ncbi:conserved hypothetical protein [Rippkaea orientalis PCC 8801]|uniref:Uncharacterized protein n=1 Tax=Rippkaea orientalis (strain PCC 8801 / RF-1) TaxID=41431 RepID=B7K218_RIPO1|nr:hypothetical protein [Rippkaea orientalis]ACK64325.1 conserved hypothetical protein [Rippkaea orientalis PCC 8801]